MFIFETTLSKDEVKERFLSRVQICDTNPRRFVPRLMVPELPRGNMAGDKLWFDYRAFDDIQLKLLLYILPAYHEFRGDLQETESGTKISGVFSGHPIAKLFLIGFPVVLIFGFLRLTSIPGSVTDVPASITSMLFLILLASVAWFITNKLHAKQTAHMIQYLEILWNATCHKE